MAKSMEEIESLCQNLALERRIATLTDKQLQPFAAWLDDRIAIVASLGGNRSGKTWGLAPSIAGSIRGDQMWALPPGSSVLCVAKDSAQSARKQQKEMWDLLPNDKFDTNWSGPKNGFGSKNPTVIYDKGGRDITIYFMTDTQYQDDPYAFEAIDANVAWIDEACSAGCFAAIGVRLGASKNAKMAVSSIRNLEWVEDMIDDAEVDESLFIEEFEPSDNPVMNESMVARMTTFARYGGEDIAAMRIEGKGLHFGARVYTEFERQRHVITHRDFHERTSGDVVWYGCMDEGMDHPTVFLLVAVARNRKIYVYDQYVSRNTTPEQDVPAIEAVIGDRTLNWPTVADDAMWQHRKTGMSADRYREAGLELMPCPPKRAFGEDRGVMMIKDLLRSDELFVCESCTELIRNFMKWKYKRERHTGNRLGADRYEDKNNDALDALRYLIQYEPPYEKQVAEGIPLELD